MRGKARGFTMIELVFGLSIGAILTSIALAGFQNAFSAVAVRNAKSMYATLHQRARARSVEMGETVLFFVDAAGDSAFFVSNGVVSDVTRFRSELEVGVVAVLDAAGEHYTYNPGASFEIGERMTLVVLGPIKGINEVRVRARQTEPTAVSAG